MNTLKSTIVHLLMNRPEGRFFQAVNPRVAPHINYARNIITMHSHPTIQFSKNRSGTPEGTEIGEWAWS